METKCAVYVVDDDPGARESVAAVVESMGVTAVRCDSSESFFDQYDASACGCVVADLRMPGKSGLDLLKRVNEQGIALPVVIISAFADVTLAVRAMQNGAITVLQKPCRDSELWEAIQQGLAGGSQLRERKLRQQELERRYAMLTSDELQVLDRVMQGIPNKQIASELELGVRTVESRRQSIMIKLHANSVAELVRLIVETRQPKQACLTAAGK